MMTDKKSRIEIRLVDGNTINVYGSHKATEAGVKLKGPEGQWFIPMSAILYIFFPEG